MGGAGDGVHRLSFCVLSSTSTALRCVAWRFQTPQAGWCLSFWVPVQRFTTAIRLAAAWGGVHRLSFWVLSSTSTALRCVAWRLQTPKAGWCLSFWVPVQRFTTAIRLAAAWGGVHRLSLWPTAR